MQDKRHRCIVPPMLLLHGVKRDKEWDAVTAYYEDTLSNSPEDEGIFRDFLPPDHPMPGYLDQELGWPNENDLHRPRWPVR